MEKPKLTQQMSPSVKQTQHLVMLPHMQQALQILQMPVMDLAVAIEMELEQNPLLEVALDDEPLDGEEIEDREDHDPLPEAELEFDHPDMETLNELEERTTDDDRLQTFLESSILDEPSLFEKLMQQAVERFSDPEDLKLAEAIIGNLNGQGFLDTPLSEIAILTQSTEEKLKAIVAEVQTFEPYGIAASSLKESLLIQMRCLGKEKSLAYEVVRDHFDDLLHNRLPLIRKELHCAIGEVQKAILDLSKLDFHPGTESSPLATAVIPDASLHREEEKWVVTMSFERLPSIQCNARYMKLLSEGEENKAFLREKLAAAKGFLHSIEQRESTLVRLVEALAKHQEEFFLDPNGRLKPLTLKTIAEELQLHESTIARAVMQKYLDSPRGVIPLHTLFSNALPSDSSISSQTVREALKRLIDKEDKHHPLSDEVLMHALKEGGFSCARRTVAKYRGELQLGSAHQRKQF